MAQPAAVPQTKTCSKCGLTKALADFRPGRRHCRACRTAQAKTWRANNRERVLESKKRDWDKRKDQVNAQRRDPQYLAHASTLRAARRERNGDAVRATERAYRQRNQAKVAEWQRGWYERAGLEWNRAWRVANPEKVRDHNHRRRAATRKNVAAEVVERIAFLLTQPCAYCGSPVGIEIDHVVPLSRGGRHEVSNLAAACRPCNRSKHNKLLTEWERH